MPVEGIRACAPPRRDLRVAEARLEEHGSRTDGCLAWTEPKIAQNSAALAGGSGGARTRIAVYECYQRGPFRDLAEFDRRCRPGSHGIGL